MGNKQSASGSAGDREAGWLVVDIFPEDAISFNPASSCVLCAGIGEQGGFTEKKANLGPAADQDSIGVAKLFHKKFHIPDDQIILLTSKTMPATNKSILSALKHQAGQVKEDGILVFQFSGHVLRIEKKNTVVFLPANFDGTSKTVITVQKLLRAFHKTKAKYVVMVMDCCYAGGVAEELVLNISDEVPTYILASCTSTQKSLSFNQLGNGFFTYFFLKFFDSYHKATFPLKEVVTYCKPLCNAINKLLRPGFDSEASMSPMILWNTYKIKLMDLKKKDEVFDETDAVQEDPLAYARRYHRQYSSQRRDADSPWEKSEVPEHVVAWLHVEAYESLKYLHDMKVLKKSEKGLFSTILAFVAQSVASLTYQELKKTNNILTIFKASTLLEGFITISEILYKTINYNLAPGVLDLRLYIEYYASKVKTLSNFDYDYPEFAEIVLLLTCVVDDHKQSKKSAGVGGRMHKGFDATDGDEADGAGDEVVDKVDEVEVALDSKDMQKLGAYLDNLPLANTIVELPKILDVEDEEGLSDDEESEEKKDA
ncbi:uncharacterized protein LOC135496897 [Lineus longissimus]|uniref:uncharacterized protein LOC135496897 n=1 Tax=Lineus longissimus TaxID=88925 RepID=UPI002B4DE0A7